MLVQIAFSICFSPWYLLHSCGIIVQPYLYMTENTFNRWNGFFKSTLHTNVRTHFGNATDHRQRMYKLSIKLCLERCYWIWMGGMRAIHVVRRIPSYIQVCEYILCACVLVHCGNFILTCAQLITGRTSHVESFVLKSSIRCLTKRGENIHIYNLPSAQHISMRNEKKGGKKLFFIQFTGRTLNWSTATTTTSWWHGWLQYMDEAAEGAPW